MVKAPVTIFLKILLAIDPEFELDRKLDVYENINKFFLNRSESKMTLDLLVKECINRNIKFIFFNNDDNRLNFYLCDNLDDNRNVFISINNFVLENTFKQIKTQGRQIEDLDQVEELSKKRIRLAKEIADVIIYNNKILV